MRLIKIELTVEKVTVTLEGVAAVQNTLVVENQKVPGLEQNSNLERRIIGKRLPNPQCLVYGPYELGRHVQRRGGALGLESCCRL